MSEHMEKTYVMIKLKLVNSLFEVYNMTWTYKYAIFQ